MADCSTTSIQTSKLSEPSSLLKTEGLFKLLTSNNPFGLKEPPTQKPRPADLLSSKHLNWPKITYKGGTRSLSPEWNNWVKKLRPIHNKQWEILGISDSIEASLLTIHTDKKIMDTLVSFWCGETNTFITDWGEISFTLEDAHVLGNMPLRGGRVCRELEGEEEEWYEKLIEERSKIASKVTLKQWVLHFELVEDSMLEHIGFLAFFLQRSLLPNGPENDVPSCVYGPAIRLALGEKLALAPAVMASLYAGFSEIENYLLEGKESSKKVFAPFWLLQLWAWERFPSISPLKRELETDIRVRMLQWGSRWRSSSLADVIWNPDSFIWRPYARVEDENQKLEMADFLTIISPNELLAYCNTNSDDVPLVAYKPYRVARQFGLDQGIPIEMCYTGDVLKAWEKYIEEPTQVEIYVPSHDRTGRADPSYSRWMDEVLSMYKKFKEAARYGKGGEEESTRKSLRGRKVVKTETLEEACLKKRRTEGILSLKKGSEGKEESKKGKAILKKVKIKMASLKELVPEATTYRGNNDTGKVSECMHAIFTGVKVEEAVAVKEQISHTLTPNSKREGEVGGGGESGHEDKGISSEEVDARKKKRKRRKRQEVRENEEVLLQREELGAVEIDKKTKGQEVRENEEVLEREELGAEKRRHKKRKGQEVRENEEVLLARVELSIEKKKNKERKGQGVREIKEVILASKELAAWKKKTRKRKGEEVRENEELLAIEASKETDVESFKEYPIPQWQGVEEGDELLVDFWKSRMNTQKWKKKEEKESNEKENGKQRRREREAVQENGVNACMDSNTVEEYSEERITSYTLEATLPVVGEEEGNNDRSGKEHYTNKFEGSKDRKERGHKMALKETVGEAQLSDKLTVISHSMEASDLHVVKEVCNMSITPKIVFENQDKSVERQSELARELIQFEKDGYLVEQDSESEEMDIESEKCGDIYGKKALKRYRKFFCRVSQHPTYPGFDFSSSGVGEFCATAFWMNYVPTIKDILKASRKNPHANIADLRQELAGLHRAGFNTEHIDSYLNELERLRLVLEEFDSKEKLVLSSLDKARYSQKEELEKLQSYEDEVQVLQAVIGSLEEQLRVKQQNLRLKQEEAEAFKNSVTKSSVANIEALEENYKTLLFQRESVQADMAFLLQRSLN
ncbi:uncharacterized protein LOC143847865 isoform X2 [Tasmannia lanceolata]|uniref:uncharacterized protein LOC143847865 isoform X2 n=1 Tax=Tasmannia lanceolata TaxID=3420 RepID=UPI004063328F